MRISDWSSDVCSSDLRHVAAEHLGAVPVDVLPSAETGAVFDAFHGFLLVIHPCKTSSLGSRLREAPPLRSGRGWRAERAGRGSGSPRHAPSSAPSGPRPRTSTVEGHRG